VAAMVAVGHPNCRYVATACAAYPPVNFLDKVRKALSRGAHVHPHLRPVPQGLGLPPLVLPRAGRAGGALRPAAPVWDHRRTGGVHVRPWGRFGGSPSSPWSPLP